jgi:hypothetical protein
VRSIGNTNTHEDEESPESNPIRVIEKRAFESLGRVGGSIQRQTNEDTVDAPVVQAAKATP